MHPLRIFVFSVNSNHNNSHYYDPKPNAPPHSTTSQSNVTGMEESKPSLRRKDLSILLRAGNGRFIVTTLGTIRKARLGETILVKRTMSITNRIKFSPAS
jgi:hypothetical protein